MGERRNGAGQNPESDRKRIVREMDAIHSVADSIRALVDSGVRISTLPAAEMARLRDGAKAIQEGAQVFQEAFRDKNLIRQALSVVDDIMFIPAVTAHVLPVVAANTEAIVTHIREYPENISLPLKVLSFTKMGLAVRSEEEPSARRRVAKITQLTTKALPDLEVYFSDANQAEDDKLVERFFALSALITLVDLNRSSNDWMKKIYPKLLASLLMSDRYSDTPPPIAPSENIIGLNHAEMIKMLSGVPRRELFRRFFTRYAEVPGALSSAMSDVFTEIGMPADYLIGGIGEGGAIIGLDECIPDTGEGTQPTNLEIMLDQLEAIRALERERPGAAAILFRAYGIRFFSRYPTELLKKQYDNRDIDMPFGIVTTGIWDSNQAFFERENTHDLYRKLDRQLSSVGHGIRFTEVNGNEEFERQLRFMREAYGEGNKASFIWMRAHGHKWSLAFGPSEASGYLLHSHLQKRNYSQFNDVFVPGFTSVLEGCSIARGAGSIAAEWSRVFPEGLVHAPPGMNVSSIDIEVLKKEGKPVLDVSYVVNQQAYWVPPNTYKNGKRYSVQA